MRTEIQMKEMMRILNRYQESEITCKRITHRIREEQAMDKYQLAQEQQKARIYEGDKCFSVPLDGVRQVCLDTGLSMRTHEKYMMFTISYELFDYISLNVVC